jgi:Kef-type K+ transport system membrane component KefB
MTPFLSLALLIAILLVCAKAGGYLATRLDQPSVLGEILVGVILGPSLVNLTQQAWFADPFVSGGLNQFAQLGVLLLMFIAGLELRFDELLHNLPVSTLAGFLGVLLPVGLGLGVGLLFGMDSTHAVFLGLTLGATSVSISAQTFMELGRLRSRVGLSLLGAAVIDDILVILLLSIYTALEGGTGGAGQILGLVGRMVAFFALSVALGLWGLPFLSRIVANLPVAEGPMSLALVVMLLYGVAAELLGGVAAITGAFLAGLMFARTPERELVQESVHGVAYGLFVPLFFANIGLGVDARQMGVGSLVLVLAISLVAVLGKVVGCGLGGWLGRLSRWESLQLGVGMISRGEVGLIVARVGLDSGLLSQEVFSSIVVVVIITTLITPPLVKLSFSKAPAAEAELAEEPLESMPREGDP